mmetsp:Transcript_11496/g.36866  ORF Transcript_11496/g.36866 Transcript_11496/m.36866 type:complete len:241 (+) Transcript_11496:1838-2560(+)
MLVAPLRQNLKPVMVRCKVPPGADHAEDIGKFGGHLVVVRPAPVDFDARFASTPALSHSCSHLLRVCLPDARHYHAEWRGPSARSGFGQRLAARRVALEHSQSVLAVHVLELLLERLIGGERISLKVDQQNLLFAHAEPGGELVHGAVAVLSDNRCEGSKVLVHEAVCARYDMASEEVHLAACAVLPREDVSFHAAKARAERQAERGGLHVVVVRVCMNEWKRRRQILESSSLRKGHKKP